MNNKYTKQRVSPCHVRLIFPDPKDADEFMAEQVEQEGQYWAQVRAPDGSGWIYSTGFPRTVEGLEGAFSFARWTRDKCGTATRVVLRSVIEMKEQ